MNRCFQEKIFDLLIMLKALCLFLYLIAVIPAFPEMGGCLA
jgi:hypothetical protein